MLLHGIGLGEGCRKGHSQWWTWPGHGDGCAPWKACRCWSKCAVTQGELVDARAP